MPRRKKVAAACMACDEVRTDINMVTVPAHSQGRRVIGIALVCRGCIVGGKAKIPQDRIFPDMVIDQEHPQERSAP